MAILTPGSPLSRRAFLGTSAPLTGGALLTLTALERLPVRAASAQTAKPAKLLGYGPLAPTAPADDPAGFEILALPAGFQYVSFSAIGELMSDGTPVPTNLD